MKLFDRLKEWMGLRRLLRELPQDRRPIGADKAHRAGFDGFRPLGHIGHHEHRLAQGRPLFLDAAAIG